MIDPKKQQQFETSTLQEWAAETLGVLRDEVRARQGYVPSRAFEGLKYRVLAAAQGNPATAFFSFEDAGRINEMRRIQFSKRPIEQGNNFILDWVKKKGIEKFKFVPGYTSASRVGISREKAASRIASAIIIAKAGRVHVPKSRGRRRVYAKNFYRQVSVLVRKLLDEQGQLLLDGTVKELKETFGT